MIAPAFKKGANGSMPELAQESSIQVVAGQYGYFLDGIKAFYYDAISAQVDIQLEVINGLGREVPRGIGEYMSILNKVRLRG